MREGGASVLNSREISILNMVVLTALKINIGQGFILYHLKTAIDEKFGHQRLLDARGGRMLFGVNTNYRANAFVDNRNQILMVERHRKP
ncbi:hypothetical protein V6N12_003067 [Hibiscus sabdariffa]|uniref:Uncharacterized protein n=1 Tax=Hibiscus sabdariffa TaxID=183260 RepID=A0ABR2EAT9_9ROSI